MHSSKKAIKDNISKNEHKKGKKSVPPSNKSFRYVSVRSQTKDFYKPLPVVEHPLINVWETLPEKHVFPTSQEDEERMLRLALEMSVNKKNLQPTSSEIVNYNVKTNNSEQNKIIPPTSSYKSNVCKENASLSNEGCYYLKQNDKADSIEETNQNISVDSFTFSKEDNLSQPFPSTGQLIKDNTCLSSENSSCLTKNIKTESEVKNQSFSSGCFTFGKKYELLPQVTCQVNKENLCLFDKNNFCLIPNDKSDFEGEYKSPSPDCFTLNRKYELLPQVTRLSEAKEENMSDVSHSFLAINNRTETKGNRADISYPSEGNFSSKQSSDSIVKEKPKRKYGPIKRTPFECSNYKVIKNEIITDKNTIPRLPLKLFSELQTILKEDG